MDTPGTEAAGAFWWHDHQKGFRDGRVAALENKGQGLRGVDVEARTTKLVGSDPELGKASSRSCAISIRPASNPFLA